MRTVIRAVAVPTLALSLMGMAFPADATARSLKHGAQQMITFKKWGQAPTPPVAAPPAVAPPTTAPTSPPVAKPIGRATRLSDPQARKLLSDNGISVHSSGNCSDRKNSTCTSLDTIVAAVVLDTIELKKTSRCAVSVTGGTETGHAAGTYSHWNGYKIDLRRTTCLSAWIPKNGKALGSSRYQIGTGVYWYETSHWDVMVKP